MPITGVASCLLGLLMILIGAGTAVEVVAELQEYDSQQALLRDAGRVKFYVKANSSFDPWTKAPSAEQQQWMRDHYDRMVTYSPYFDSRLQWFPNAWVYRNAYGIKPAWALHVRHPAWILKDASGRNLYIPYGCQQGQCPQFAADLSHPDYRAHWLNQSEELLARGYIGLRIDDVNLTWRVSDGTGAFVNPIDRQTGQPMTLQAYRQNMVTLLEETRKRFPSAEIVHNVIWYAAPLHNPLLQRQILAADLVGLQRGVSDRGIAQRAGEHGFDRFLAFVDRVHGLDRGIIFDDDDRDNQSPQNRDYELAFYFLVNQGRDLLGADGDRQRMNPVYFYEGYRVDMGTPEGGRFRTASGLLRRNFKNGFVLVNPPGEHRRCLQPALPVMGEGGAMAERVCLPSPGGLVYRYPDS